MKREKTKSVLLEYCRSLHRLGERVRSKFQKQDIHRFRVEYKRMRAFLRLCRLARRDRTPIKIDRLLKAAYRQAGACRDLQLLMLRLGRTHGLSEAAAFKSYLSVLKTRLHRLQGSLQEILKKEPAKRMARKLHSLSPDAIHEAHLRKFLKKRQLQMQAAALPGAWTEESLHALRKTLKDYLFISKNYGNPKPKESTANAAKDAADLKKLSRDLGILQDWRNALRLLSTGQPADEGTRTALREIRREWTRQKNLLKNRLLRQLAARPPEPNVKSKTPSAAPSAAKKRALPPKSPQKKGKFEQAF